VPMLIIGRASQSGSMRYTPPDHQSIGKIFN